MKETHVLRRNAKEARYPVLLILTKRKLQNSTVARATRMKSEPRKIPETNAPKARPDPNKSGFATWNTGESLGKNDENLGVVAVVFL